jgi:hypothetical protein
VKGGAGKGNWGKEETNGAEVEADKDAESSEEEEEAADDSSSEEEEEEVTVSYEEYLASKKVSLAVRFKRCTWFLMLFLSFMCRGLFVSSRTRSTWR